MLWFFNLILVWVIVFLMTRKRRSRRIYRKLTPEEEERILNTFPEETREAYKSMMEILEKESEK